LEESINGLTIKNKTLEEEIVSMTESFRIGSDVSTISASVATISVATQTDFPAAAVAPDPSIADKELAKERKLLQMEREQLDMEKQKFAQDLEEVHRLRTLLASEQQKVSQLKEEVLSLSLEEKGNNKSGQLVISPVAIPATPAIADASRITAEEVLHRLESASGLSAMMYTTTSSPSSKGKFKASSVSIRKVADPASPSSGNTFLEIDHHTGIPSLSGRAAGDKIRFALSDMKMVLCEKGVGINIPDSVATEICLSLTVEGHGEINLVMTAKDVRDLTGQVLQGLLDEHSSSGEVESTDGEPASNCPLPIVSASASFSTPPRSPASAEKSQCNINVSGIPTSSLSRTKSNNSMLHRSPAQKSSSSTSPFFNSPTWKDVDSPVAQYINGTAAKATIVMRGWAAKEDEKSHASKAWTRRYIVLEKETKQIKYGVSEAFVSGFPGQLRGVVQLERGMKCAITKGPSTWLTARNGSVLEISNASSGVVMRMQVESDREMHNWVSSINSVLAGGDDDTASVASTVTMNTATSSLSPAHKVPSQKLRK
jgi:hypothetical protein